MVLPIIFVSNGPIGGKIGLKQYLTNTLKARQVDISGGIHIFDPSEEQFTKVIENLTLMCSVWKWETFLIYGEFSKEQVDTIEKLFRKVQKVDKALSQRILYVNPCEVVKTEFKTCPRYFSDIYIPDIIIAGPAPSTPPPSGDLGQKRPREDKSADDEPEMKQPKVEPTEQVVAEAGGCGASQCGTS